MLASYIIYQISKVDPYVGSDTQTKFNFGGKVIEPEENLLRERVELL